MATRPRGGVISLAPAILQGIIPGDLHDSLFLKQGPSYDVTHEAKISCRIST